MNLLFLCDEYPPGRHGGIGTAVQLLSRALVAQGHRVVVAGFYEWGYQEQDQFEDEGVIVYRFRPGLDTVLLSNRNALPVRAALQLLQITGILQWDIQRSLNRYGFFLDELLTKHQIDLIEIPDYQGYMAACLGRVHFPRLARPYVVKLHGSMTYFAREAGEAVPAHIFNMERELLSRALAVASVSEYTARSTSHYLDYQRPIRVLYNGIDLTAQAPLPKRPASAIFTGSLITKKGIYQLIKAWNRVQLMVPEARLTVYGKGPIDKIVALLEKDALPTVEFCGHVNRSTLMQKLAQARVAVFPSYAECFALAPMEAMAMGTAVIYSTRTSGAELISHRHNGLLCDPDDVEELARQIIEMLRNDALCQQLAEAGCAHVRNRFAISRIAAEHARWYQEVLWDNAPVKGGRTPGSVQPTP